MAAIRRSLLLAPALALSLGAGGLVSAAAAVPTPVVPPVPRPIDLSSDPLFDDLVPLRGVRARLLISRDALAAGDVAKAGHPSTSSRPATRASRG
jgi:hypothetical protein